MPRKKGFSYYNDRYSISFKLFGVRFTTESWSRTEEAAKLLVERLTTLLPKSARVEMHYVEPADR